MKALSSLCHFTDPYIVHTKPERLALKASLRSFGHIWFITSHTFGMLKVPSYLLGNVSINLPALNDVRWERWGRGRGKANWSDHKQVARSLIWRGALYTFFLLAIRGSSLQFEVKSYVPLTPRFLIWTVLCFITMPTRGWISRAFCNHKCT